MIFNDDFLFIHVPKTAGMSLSEALLKSLRGSVIYTVPDGHAEPTYGEEVVNGKRHETLPEANEWFKKNGLDKTVEDFKYLVSMVRNPYDLEISRYHYLRKGHKWDSGHAQDLALAGDLEKFVLGSRWWFEFNDYYEIEGRLPSNLFVIRYETFVQDMKKRFSECYKVDLDIPELNKTTHGGRKSYLTPSLEKAIYNKYKWIFDKGYYSREWF